MAEFLINGFLIFLLAIIAVIAIRSIKIFSTVMLAGAYSLICAIIFVSLDAVDVAFTEAAVGAGVSTILVLATIILTKRRAKEWKASENLRPLALVILTGGILEMEIQALFLMVFILTQMQVHIRLN